jgi:hypothetical protein
MTALTTHDVSTLTVYMQKVTQSLVGTGNSSWFRGVGQSSNHKLIPNIFRHPSYATIDEFLKSEREMLDLFRDRSIMFRQPQMAFSDDKELDTLVVMQHFGVPTRLLDWTENPFVALYFALTSARMNYSLSPPDFDDDAAVWILNPAEWNYQSRGQRPSDRCIFSLDNQSVSYYKPQVATNINGANIPGPVVAVYGRPNNARVVAQRGMFTLFGHDIHSLEDQYTASTYAANILTKLIIPKASIDPLLRQLAAIGFTDSTIFPDLAGVALEIKRQFGFRI